MDTKKLPHACMYESHISRKARYILSQSQVLFRRPQYYCAIDCVKRKWNQSDRNVLNKKRTTKNKNEFQTIK